VSDVVQPIATLFLEHTYVVAFGAALVDATGIPFPGRFILIAAGAFAATGDISAVVLIALGAAGVIVTDHLWYFTGSLGGDRLLRFYCWLTLSASDCVQRTTEWFNRYGALTILVGRFVGPVRMLAWPLARAHGVGYPTFLVFDVLAALLWSVIWVGLGWVLGERLAAASPQTRWIGVGVAVVVGAIFLGVRLWRHRRGGPQPGPANPRLA
jgi:membrane protein DedA with SNARE-associated domain